MKTLTVKVPELLDAALEHLAAFRGRSKSAVVREALQTAVEEGSKGKPRSCAALAADLAGCFEGPIDLSSNKKYMRGYGR